MAAALEAGAATGAQPGRAAARAGGKGRFLLRSFNEVLDNLEATACSLREAYSDAVYFKCALSPLCTGPAHDPSSSLSSYGIVITSSMLDSLMWTCIMILT